MTEGPTPGTGMRPFRARLSGRRRLGPHFVEITLTGPQLHGIVTPGLDQRVKIVLPGAGGGTVDTDLFSPETVGGGTWYRTWLELPPER